MKKLFFSLILCLSMAALPALAEIAVGNQVTFGVYEQDNDLTNGAEPLLWQVLEVSGDQVLLITVQAVESLQFHEEWTSVTWAECSLRTWLNDGFLRAAFTEAEQAAIRRTLVSTQPNLSYKTMGGDDVEDLVFILSIEEARQYLKSSKARKVQGTPWAEEQQLYVKRGGTNAGFSPWWLRSMGQGMDSAAYVKEDGNILFKGIDVDYYSCGVRPVMWISLDAIK